MAKRGNPSRKPGFKEEKFCAEQGFSLIAGIDEVGRGCLAGPVVASAVIMPLHRRFPWYKQVRDSKFLTAEQREYLSPCIQSSAIAVGSGAVEATVIDDIGMTAAVRLAMTTAIGKLLPQPDYALIDYLTIPDLALPHKGVEDGDTLCFSIACASIVAKVFRDQLMTDMDEKYPGYHFANHKGYGTENHFMCLRERGPSPIHRYSFQPVRDIAQYSFDESGKPVLKPDTYGLCDGT